MLTYAGLEYQEEEQNVYVHIYKFILDELLKKMHFESLTVACVQKIPLLSGPFAEALHPLWKRNEQHFVGEDLKRNQISRRSDNWTITLSTCNDQTIFLLVSNI